MSGVYISYPFCSRKCTYCNFYSGVFTAELERDYQQALFEEVARWNWSWIPETLYLGGGSPSRMPIEFLARLLEKIPGRPWKEATIEVVPGEVTPEKARWWRQLGLNRASLGAQSFVQRELRATGRLHDALMIARDFQWLREAGFERVNIDLIAGLPYQTLESWRVSLDWIRRLQPDHVSVYMLEIDEKSRLGREILQGGTRYHAQAVPSEDMVVTLYELAAGELENLGIHQYEISNFARRGFESLHNLKYWRLERYVGFGADAHSYDGTWRWRNAETPVEYVNRYRQGLPFDVERVLADPVSERLFLGLRLREGVCLSAEERERFNEAIEQLVASGLLELEGARLRLTSRGLLLSNEVFQAFV